MNELITENVEYIKSRISDLPEVGIVLGSGLGSLGEKIINPKYIDYKDLKGFAVSTAPGHKGRFIFGKLAGKNVVCMQGRLHYYEGFTFDEIVLPIRVMKLLGIKNLILTNAAGGINKSYNVGDIVLINDHINFMGRNPLIGKNDNEVGARFPDMSFAYDPKLCELAKACSKETEVEIKDGVYIACSGPSYETPAEIRAFRTLGADVVGMSTVPEVIAANHCGVKVLAFSLVSNMAAGILKKPLSEDEVLEAGARKGAEMQKLIVRIIEKM